MESPYVSVIVPVYNGEAHISACIGSLLDQNYSKHKYEILIVDNGSTDKTREIVRRFPVNLLFEDIKNSYAARNKGILNSCGDVIAFTDADCIVDRDWIKKSVGILNGEADFIAGKIEFLLSENPSPIELYGLYRFLIQEKFAKDGWAATANMITKREIFEKVGLFNQQLVSGGDLEWGKRASRMGYKVVYGENVVVKHSTRKSFIDQFFCVFRYGVGLGQISKTMQKNMIKNDNKKTSRVFKMLFKDMRYGCVEEIERLKKYRKINKSNVMFLQILILILLYEIGYIYGKIYGYTKNIQSIQRYLRQTITRIGPMLRDRIKFPDGKIVSSTCLEQ